MREEELINNLLKGEIYGTGHCEGTEHVLHHEELLRQLDIAKLLLLEHVDVPHADPAEPLENATDHDEASQLDQK